MSFLDKLSALSPFGKKEEVLEYFFALNINLEKLTASLWTIEGKHLKILEAASEDLTSLDDLTPTADKLLDKVLGIRQLDVQKILFGVPSTWLSDENLKEENLKILRGLVKELELAPMAYVESANAVVHYLETLDGVPPTAVLVGFGKKDLTVTVVRAGKLDGVKVVTRGDNSGTDIEKALLTFTAVETLPSRILLYGEGVSTLKSQLLSFPWMSKLSFLHFPKIDFLPEDIEIKSVCLAGASEINPAVVYVDQNISELTRKTSLIPEIEEIEEPESKAQEVSEPGEEDVETADDEIEDEEKVESEDAGFGFMVGDVAALKKDEEELPVDSEPDLNTDDDLISAGEELEESDLAIPEESNLAEVAPESPKNKFNFKLPFLKFSFHRKFKSPVFLLVAGILLIVLGAYLLLPKADVKIFVEPQILEKDTQVTADPNQKTVNEDSKIIPGKIVDAEISGSDKESATGKKQVGDPAKGTVIIYNKTSESKSLGKGTVLSSNGIKFALDSAVNIASQSASDSGITFGKANGNVTAQTVGAEGNLPSGSELSVGGFSSGQVSAKAEGNFSGGTSKEVMVVSSEDQQRLLAKLSSTLRQQAQQKLQEKYPDQKVLAESLSENIVKRSYNKNINDQASEFSLNLSVNYKGTAYDDKDLRLIVSKLVTTDVPSGFELNLEDTETQADVSKLEKDGKLIFLARFKAKLMPKIDTEKIKNQIKGQSVTTASNLIKSMEHILGSEIKVSPKLPTFLQRLPILGRNIKIEVGLK